jgi:hypothetical protein
VRGNQTPVYFVSKERIDMLITGCLAGTIKDRVTQPAHPWHQLDAQIPAQAKDWLALTMCIGMKRVGLDLRTVFGECIEDVDAFQHTAGYEAGEQGDVGN